MVVTCHVTPLFLGICYAVPCSPNGWASRSAGRPPAELIDELADAKKERKKEKKKKSRPFVAS